jgi:hypothetical protein
MIQVFRRLRLDLLLDGRLPGGTSGLSDRLADLLLLVVGDVEFVRDRLVLGSGRPVRVVPAVPTGAAVMVLLVGVLLTLLRDGVGSGLSFQESLFFQEDVHFLRRQTEFLPQDSERFPNAQPFSSRFV